MSPKKHAVIRNVSTLLICASLLVASLFIDWTDVADRIDAIGFEPTAEISALENALNLTGKAKVIFAASRPAIESENTFNQACSSTNSEVSVLGCYDGRRIHIYNIENPELDGIKQSTLAHELLHAAWNRLPNSIKDGLKPNLNTIYNSHRETLEARLALYPESDFYDELHSIIGTEFAVLPDALEAHYQKYFNNQDNIVAFYDNYDAKFKELEATAKALYAQITINQEVITAKTANYDAAASELSLAVSDFNRRAESGYFTSTAAFYAERATLVARQQSLSTLYNEISNLVNTTNELIEQYNSNIARTQVLLDSINSNAAPTPELK